MTKSLRCTSDMQHYELYFNYRKTKIPTSQNKNEELTTMSFFGFQVPWLGCLCPDSMVLAQKQKYRSVEKIINK